MAGSKADYLEDQVLKWATGQTNGMATTPTPYLALFTTAPSDAGGGVEVSGGSYARVSSAGKWAAVSGGSVSNNASISFATAAASWGTVVAMGIFDAASAGNLLYWGDLTVPKTVGAGDTASFAASSLTLTES